MRNFAARWPLVCRKIIGGLSNIFVCGDARNDIRRPTTTNGDIRAYALHEPMRSANQRRRRLYFGSGLPGRTKVANRAALIATAWPVLWRQADSCPVSVTRRCCGRRWRGGVSSIYRPYTALNACRKEIAYGIFASY